MPVLVFVIVKVLAPVSTIPFVRAIVAVFTLLAKVSVAAAFDLFKVMALKVVAPVILVFAAPVKATVLVPEVNVPLLIQLFFKVKVWLEPLSIAPVCIFIILFTVVAPTKLFVPPVPIVKSS